MAQTRKNLVILSVFYLLSRIVFLTRFPIFNDEAIYLREAWVVTHVPGQLWYSLADSGKQPLLIWLYGLAWQLIGNPLLAGRLISVGIGVTTVWAVYLLGGWTAAILVLAAPLFVFFDRLALVDSALAAVFAWLLVVLVRLQKQNALRTAIFAGLLVGISFWIKSTGFLLALVAVFEFAYVWYTQKKAFPIALVLLIFVAVAGIVGLPMFIRPEAVHIFGTANLYTYSLTELLGIHFGNAGPNVWHAFLDYAAYVSPLVVIAFLISLGSLRTQKKRILITAMLLSFAVIVIFGKNIHGRYVLFTTVPMLVLSSFVLSAHKVIFAFTVSSMILLSSILIIDPPAFFHLFTVPELRSESYQYIDGWPSGYGVKEAMAAIDTDRRGEHAIVAIRWDSGNPEDGMFVYATEETGVTLLHMDPRIPDETRMVLDSAAGGRVYFVTRQGQYNGFERYLVPMAQFIKPGGMEKVELLRVRI